MIVEPRWLLPRGWDWTSVGTIADVAGGGTPPANDPLNFSDDGGIPWVTPADLTGYENAYIARGRRNLSSKGYNISSAKLLPAGAVLFTSRAPIGYCAIAANPIATNQGFKSLTLFGGISGEFTRHYLRWSKPFLESLASGTTFLELSGSKLQQVPFPLPPLAEQKRIVVKLDALNARSARARAELARIETLVSRYKQAVLSKAFSGELTSAQFAEPDSDRSAGHPAHWKQMQLGDIADIKSGITLGKKRKPNEQLLELPYLRVANVQRGWLDLREIKTIEVTAKEAAALLLREGDVLMNEGGDRDKLGRGWVWDGQIPDCIHQNHVFRVRLASRTVPPRFLSYYANEFGQKHFFDEGKQTTNLASISKSKLAAMKVPVPPIEEAEEIVRQVEFAFAQVNRVAKEAKRALDLVGRLEEAILAKAFRGELVPQDPNDEPASELIERIGAWSTRVIEKGQGRPAKNAERAVRSGGRMTATASPLTKAADAMPAQQKDTSMSKTRQDPDVMGQPYLSKILRKHPGAKTVDALFKAANLPVADFYKQLAWEIENQHIRDEHDRLEAA